jgi:hypothetical protein
MEDESPSANTESDDFKKCDQQSTDLVALTVWGVAPPEALKAIETADAAYTKLITKDLFGTEELPTDWLGIEYLFFKAIKQSSDPAKELREMLNREDFSDRMNKDPGGFIRRLHDFMESKRGDDFDKIDNLLVAFWTHQMPSRRLPAFCLMTDRFLVWALGIPSEDAARQRVQRLGLYRPLRPRITMEEVIKDGQSFARSAFKVNGKRCSDAEFQEFFAAYIQARIQRLRAEAMPPKETPQS